MYYVLMYGAGCLCFLCIGYFVVAQSSVSAQNIDDSLVEAVQEKQEDVQVLDRQLQFSQFSSCENMNVVLEKYIHERQEQGLLFGQRGGGREVENTLLFENSLNMVEEPAPATSASDSIASSSPDHSITNIQKQGVREADGIKTLNKHIIYVNKQEQAIQIFAIPNQEELMSVSSIDATQLDRQKNADTIESIAMGDSLVAQIMLPTMLYNEQLFINEEQQTLIIVGERRSEAFSLRGIIDKSTRTVVAIYDVSDPVTPVMQKFHEIDGRIGKMRMIDDTVYVLTYLGVDLPFLHDIYTTDRENNLSTENQEISSTVSQEDLPKIYSLDEQNNVSVHHNDCTNINYILPTHDSEERLNLPLQFTMISQIDTVNHEKATSVILSQPSEIHMSKQALYMVQALHNHGTMPLECPPTMMCALPFVPRDQQYTLIHKFHRNDAENSSAALEYAASSMVTGAPLNQYSMDEDTQGNFRILTSVWQPEQATHLFVLDPDLQLHGQLLNIEPGERFHSSRYMGDMLYLVTFQQTDPLFVINMNDPRAPFIQGELKIPGFSTYLHPLDSPENTQYLVGLGYDADMNGRSKGVQMSLFKVDYTQQETIESKCSPIQQYEALYQECAQSVNPENIHVTQEDVLTRGDTGSWSEVLENPRMFVMDQNNTITMPLYIVQKQKLQQCTVLRNEQGELIPQEERCQDIYQRDVPFAGTVSIVADTDNHTLSPTQAYNYLDIWNQTHNTEKVPYMSDRLGGDNDQAAQYFSAFAMSQQNTRVGYYGDVGYTFANDFVHWYDRSSDELSKQLLQYVDAELLQEKQQ